MITSPIFILLFCITVVQKKEKNIYLSLRKHFLNIKSQGQRIRANGSTKSSSISFSSVHKCQRCRSQRQMEASSHTAIRILLSRLKLVCRMADTHLGRVSVVHLEKQQRNDNEHCFISIWQLKSHFDDYNKQTYLALCGSSTSRSQT